MTNGFGTAMETLVKPFSSSPMGALGFRETLQTNTRLGFFPAFVSAQKRELDYGKIQGARRLWGRAFGLFTIQWRCHSEPGKCNFTLGVLGNCSLQHHFSLPPAWAGTGRFGCSTGGIPLARAAQPRQQDGSDVVVLVLEPRTGRKHEVTTRVCSVHGSAPGGFLPGIAQSPAETGLRCHISAKQ